MVIAINANTGSEYDIDEVFDPESHQDFAQMLEITRRSSFAEDPRSIILAPAAQRRQIANTLLRLTGGSRNHVKRFLHLY